ncbi:MAG TPA: alpha/beta hydrolase [Pyrinomonadaceae bacterium]|nr:alpha/beta hydrolase [Pyrinomonadaceae bacterium]
MQTLNRLPSLSIRAITIVLTLIVGVMSTCAYESEAAGQIDPGVALASTNNQESPNKSGDISERFEIVDKIKFAPCPENPTLECGTLALPVDYHQLRGETFGLAVIRAKATKQEKRIGVLFANSGGPGSSGVNFVLGGVNAPAFIRLRERFDIVSFDVRGSHRSRAVRCEFEPAGDPTKVSEAGLVTFFDDFSHRVAQACLEQNGPFILSLSHNNIARDMDMLRRALGEQRITYVGYSFGTLLGAIYTSLFPQHVRAALLDSGIAPEFRDQRVEFRSEQGASFESVLHRLDQLCRKDTACRLHDTGVIATFDEVIAQLKAAPVTSPNGLVLESGHVANMIAPFLSVEALWPLIIDALAEARGGNYALFFQFLPAPAGVPFFSASTLGAFTAIQCNDFGTRRSAAEYLPVDEVAGALSPRIEGRFRVAAATAVCASWPKSEVPVIRNVKNQMANPILMIGNDFDPNTPLTWTRSLARALGMERSLVRYQGGGHLSYALLGNACIDRVGDAYLFDLTVPDEGLTCPAQPIRFRPATAPVDADGKWTMDAVNRDLLWGQPLRFPQN